MDLSATLELLASLTQYAEAGAVQPHTLSQAAQHALAQHGDHVDVLLAVAKLHLATSDRASAAEVVTRALELSPQDQRIAQLASELGIHTGLRAPVSTRGGGTIHPRSGPRDASESSRTKMRPRGLASDPAPPSSRTPVSRAMPEVRRTEVPTSRVKTPSVDTIAPSTPRSGDAPPLRPTVRMARVGQTTERSRWGRENSEGRGDRESLTGDDPRSGRFNAEPRSARTPEPRAPYRRDATPTPVSPMPKIARDPALRGRAGTGNLKLLDPEDERRHLDRYELIGEIASGGMATVFLARLAGVAGFQRFYAIKRLHRTSPMSRSSSTCSSTRRASPPASTTPTSSPSSRSAPARPATTS
ncbi:MAG: hypothetical protein R3F14_33615 [Polyangiaceae bacterium]